MGCELADTFALVVQGLLGVLALASLVWKRYIESPPRALVIWLMDTSKQVTGGGTAHLTNVLLGMFMDSLGGETIPRAHGSRLLQALADEAGVAPLGSGGDEPGSAADGAGAALDGPLLAVDDGIDSGSSDQCVWYLVFLTLECTLGVAILCSFLYVLNYYAERYFYLKHFVSGEYGDPPRVKLWLKQLLAYQALLLLMKVALALLVLSLHDFLRASGRALLRPLEPYPRLQLLMVMVVVPLLLTVFSFWIQVRRAPRARSRSRRSPPRSSADVGSA